MINQIGHIEHTTTWLDLGHVSKCFSYENHILAQCGVDIEDILLGFLV
jgi:hypothetical protein